MSRTLILGALCLVAAGSSGLLPCAPARAGAAAARAVTVLSTASVDGEIDHCGCQKHRLGGFARRATLVKRCRAEGGPTILLDAGNWAEVKGFEPWEKTGFLWDLMARLGYDAVTPGGHELVEGRAVLEGLYAKHPEIRVVSANITDKAGNLLWPESAVIERGGVRIGVTGAMSGAAYAFNVTRGTQKVDDFAFQDPEAALARVVPALRERTDLVVVLLQVDPTGARRLAEAIPGMDVVIVGQNPGYLFNPDRVGNTLLVRGGNRGQYLTVLDLVLGEGNSLVDFSGEGKPLGQAVPKDPEFEPITKAWEDAMKAREAAATRSASLD